MGRRSREKTHRTAAPVRVAPLPGEPVGAAETTTPDRNRNLLVAAALAVAILLVYSQVTSHQFLNYDDDIYVTANPHVASGVTGDGIAWAFRSFDVNWHPLTWISHMLDVKLFGMNAGRHLLMNVVLHALNTLLVFFLLQRLTGFTGRSAIVAALFGLHPLHVESVAWVSERKDVLSSLFMLLTLHAYASFARTRSKLHYALALLAFVLGLMSKGMLVTLPFVLLLLDYWPLRRFELTDFRALGKLVVEKLPFFGLLVPSIAITFIAQKSGGAIATAHSLGARIGNAITSYGAYIFKTFWPANLGNPYPWRELEPLQIAMALLVVVAISVWAFASAREKRYLFTGWFWFVGMLVPVIGIVQIGWQSMADRYTYLPHIGLFIAIVWLVAEGLPAELRKPAGVAGLVAVAILAGVTNAQLKHWRTSEALFSHTLRATGPNMIAHLNLGNALQDQGNQAGALAQLEAAVNAEPGNTDTLVQLARVEIQSGREKQAIERLEKAAAASPKPETVALLAAARGDKDAVDRYAAAVRSDPDSASIHNDFGTALARAGRDADAIREYREAIRLNPNLYDPRMNVAAVLSRLDRNDEARAELTAAARLRPFSAEPHVYLALVNANSNRVAEAIQNVERAIALGEPEANVRFTNAVRMPYKDTNLREYLMFLRQQEPAR